MLSNLKNTYENYLKENQFEGSPKKLYDAMDYVMQLGGKRIRPILTLLGAHVANKSIEPILPVAHAMEVFHNFTLVHDDIMDQAPTRRGKACLHLKENIPTAILAGDNMMIAAFRILLDAPISSKLEVLSVFSQTASEICDGQQMDMDFEDQSNISTQDYIEMIRLKTAVLLGACLKSGCLAAGGSQNLATSLYAFGVNTGIAFQIMDDILDTFGEQDLTGKQKGGDILAGKKTILYNLAFENANPAQETKLLQLFDKSTTSPTDRLRETLYLFESLNVEALSRNMMNSYFDKAQQNLTDTQLPFSQFTPLLDLITFLKDRNY
jgi:geranylgeranyl diphosphate synthase type II